MERLALKKSQLAIYFSDWAAQSAINNYGADPHIVYQLLLISNNSFDLGSYKAFPSILNLFPADSFSYSVARVVFVNIA